MENSKVLLERAVESLHEAGIADNLWAVGGGTVLSSIYGHRLSKDIDIFVSDPQLLSFVSPRFNSVSESALDYEETNSFVSLTFLEGKIDFINALQISKFLPVKKEFLGSNVFVEDPVEIISKKVFFRGKYAVPRDLFDLAVVYNSDRREDLLVSLDAISDKTKLFRDSFFKVIANDDFVPYSVSFQDMLLPSNFIFDGQEVVYCQLLLKNLENKNNFFVSDGIPTEFDDSWVKERLQRMKKVFDKVPGGDKPSDNGPGGGRK